VKITPQYLACAEVLEDQHRVGRSKGLTTYQRLFKQDWVQLSKKPNGGAIYDTDLKTWTCNCGQQKYNARLLCKHLVQSVPHPPARFWQHVIRRRTIPFYIHSCLQQGFDDSRNYFTDAGSITDGDDHDWDGNVFDLGGAGDWSKLLRGPSDRLLKREFEEEDEESESQAGGALLLVDPDDGDGVSGLVDRFSVQLTGTRDVDDEVS
jgi:hypothetical protein